MEEMFQLSAPTGTHWDFWVLQGFFPLFKSTKLQAGQGCSQCQGTWGKLEDGGKCPQALNSLGLPALSIPAEPSQ